MERADNKLGEEPVEMGPWTPMEKPKEKPWRRKETKVGSGCEARSCAKAGITIGEMTPGGRR